MKVILQPGETLVVGFADADTTVEVLHRGGRLQLHADQPDESGRVNFVYDARLPGNEEDFDTGVEADEAPEKHLDGPKVIDSWPQLVEEGNRRPTGAVATGARDMRDLGPQAEYRGDREPYRTRP